MPPLEKISPEIVRADFNDLLAVVHYTRAAHELGLWASERLLVERHLPDRAARILEAGCGAGRVTLGLWALGYRRLTAFDFAAEPLDQARHLATERGAVAIRFQQADATQLSRGAANLTASEPPERGQVDCATPGPGYSGALFLFNGLMQIPGRDSRRAALRGLRAVCAPGATRTKLPSLRGGACLSANQKKQIFMELMARGHAPLALRRCGASTRAEQHRTHFLIFTLLSLIYRGLQI